MVQLQNFVFFLIFLVVLCGTAAPILFQWLVSRDVSTGAPFFNGTIIPIFTSLLLVLVYIHSRGFMRSLDEAKRIVFIRARPVLLPNIIEKSSPKKIQYISFFHPEKALSIFSIFRQVFFPFFVRQSSALCFVGQFFGFVVSDKTKSGTLFLSDSARALRALLLFFHFIIIKFMGDFSYLESFCGVLCFFFFCTFFLSFHHRRDRLARHKFSFFVFHKQRRRELIISSLRRNNLNWSRCFLVRALPSRLMTVGHDFRKAPVNMKISHGGVCIFIMGVILSNAKKIQFTGKTPLGSELHIGKVRSTLRGIDQLHGPTFHSICGNLIIYKPSLKNPLMFEHDGSRPALLQSRPTEGAKLSTNGRGFSSRPTGEGNFFGPKGRRPEMALRFPHTSLALRKKGRRPEIAGPHTSLPRVPRTHKVSRALWVVSPSDASLALRGLTQKDKDILVQEVIRSILETVYEPYFLSCSHGFRPGRSQHTCLKQIRRDFVGTVWFIEGETSQCFNKIDKQVLIGLLRRRIRDNRFLNLVQKELKTSLRVGAVGTTKGVGPLLCNIVLHELDLFVMRLKRIVDRGRRRAVNPESKELWRQSAADRTTAHRARVTFPSGAFGLGLGHPQETRQINYVRFADDFLIGVIGPRALAERIRGLVTRFFEVRLKLRLNLDKTRKPIQSRPNTLPARSVPMGPKAGNDFTISAHGAPGKKNTQIFCITKNKKIPFLGYLISISRDSKHTYNLVRRGRRYKIRRSGGLSLLVDMQKVINRLAEKGFCDKSGHPKPNFAYFQYPQSYSVARIASILRGLANYYHLANSKRQCVTRLSYILRTSLAKTYAAKFKLGTAAKVFAKGGRDLSKPIKAKKGRRPLLNRVLGSKTTAHRRMEAGSEGHFPAIPYTRYGQIKLPDTKPLTKNWQPGQARLNCIAKKNLCQNSHREGNG